MFSSEIILTEYLRISLIELSIVRFTIYHYIKNYNLQS